MDLSQVVHHSSISCRRLWNMINYLSPEATFRHVLRAEMEAEEEKEKTKAATPEETLSFFEKQGALSG